MRGLKLHRLLSATVAFVLVTLVARAAHAQATAVPPTYERFVKLQKEKRWPEAVEVLRGLSLDTLRSERLAKIEKWAASARDSVTLLDVQGWTELRERAYEGQYSAAQFDAVLTQHALAYARLGREPRDAHVRAQATLLRGDTTAYLVALNAAPLDDIFWNIEKYGRERLRELYFPVLRRVVERGDTASARRLAAITRVWAMEYSQYDVMRQAMVLGGYRKEAAVLAAQWAFSEVQSPGPISKHGSPDVVLALGQAGGPANVRIGQVWADPVLQFFSGDRKGGLARMEAVADSAWPLDWRRQYSDTLQLCMILAGDLARLSGKPERAMGWYHRVTWMEYNHFLKLFMTEDYDGNNPISRTNYYRTLGVLRQAELLVAQGRHHIALDELGAIVDLDGSAPGNVRYDGVLLQHWKAMADTLQAWNERVLQGRTKVPKSDLADSLGYYANDWIEDRNGRVRARRPTRMVLEIDQLQRQAREEYLAQVRKAKDAAAEQRYAEYQETLRRAAEELEAAAPAPSSSARGQAFQFNAKQRNNVCIKCKGRGFQYVGSDVKQGWKYDPLTQGTVDTKIYTSGHLEVCNWCNGTGKR